MEEPIQISKIESFKKGIKDGAPIGLGYLSVAFAFGIAAVKSGVPAWIAILISMTNVTSAGQLAGLSLMVTGTTIVEMILTQLVINIRYALMSLSLTQKVDKTVSIFDRFVISFCNTDEVFAVASGKSGLNNRYFLYGLIVPPYLGWALGTIVGSFASTVLPTSVLSALGIAIYGMFVAIIVPPARKSKSVAIILGISIGLACLFKYVPLLNKISDGFVIIICAIVAATIGAILFPVKEEKEELK